MPANNHIVLALPAAPPMPYLKAGDPIIVFRHRGLTSSWRVETEFGRLAELRGDEGRQVTFRTRSQGAPSGYVVETQPTVVICVLFGEQAFGEQAFGEQAETKARLRSPPWWRFRRSGGSVSNGFGAGFGGCFGFLAAGVVILIVMLQSCASAFRH